MNHLLHQCGTSELMKQFHAVGWGECSQQIRASGHWTGISEGHCSCEEDEAPDPAHWGNGWVS